MVLEPHLQNVLVGVDADGLPVQAIFRDLEGTKLVTPRHDATARDAEAGRRPGPRLRRGARLGPGRLLPVRQPPGRDRRGRRGPPPGPGGRFEARPVGPRRATCSPGSRATTAGRRSCGRCSPGCRCPAKANLRLRWARGADREAAYLPVLNPLASRRPAARWSRGMLSARAGARKAVSRGTRRAARGSDARRGTRARGAARPRRRRAARLRLRPGRPCRARGRDQGRPPGPGRALLRGQGQPRPGGAARRRRARRRPRGLLRQASCGTRRRRSPAPGSPSAARARQPRNSPPRSAPERSGSMSRALTSCGFSARPRWRPTVTSISCSGSTCRRLVRRRRGPARRSGERGAQPGDGRTAELRSAWIRILLDRCAAVAARRAAGKPGGCGCAGFTRTWPAGCRHPACSARRCGCCEFARPWCAAHGVRNPEFNLGGGMAVDYRRPDDRFDWASYGRGLAAAARPGETCASSPAGP